MLPKYISTVVRICFAWSSNPTAITTDECAVPIRSSGCLIYLGVIIRIVFRLYFSISFLRSVIQLSLSVKIETLIPWRITFAQKSLDRIWFTYGSLVLIAASIYLEYFKISFAIHISFVKITKLPFEFMSTLTTW
jgi:hypothetical protein